MSPSLAPPAPFPWGRRILRALGVPVAPALARAGDASAVAPLAGRSFVAGGTGDAALEARILRLLAAAGAREERGAGATLHAAVFTATGAGGVADLGALYRFFRDVVPRLAPNARVLVNARCPLAAPDSAAAAARRGIEGFVRSLAKEIGRRGATANLLVLAEGAEACVEAPLQFLLSDRSAFVSGQPIVVGPGVAPAAANAGAGQRPGRVALVTGAAGGLGAAIARRLAEEGARVVCADLPAAGAALAALARAIDGVALALDLTAAGAPEQVAARLANLGGVDVVVHNAGILRDRTVARMDPDRWEQCLAVNLEAILRIDAALDARGLLRDGGREICLSSIAGIAGNVGQANYATAKAAVIGYASDRARRLAARGITVNAVAPGLIDTPMMRSMPWGFREIARRMNSLRQAGEPRDVAEAVAFLAAPGARGITGQTLRVCGQHLLGA